MFQSQLGHTLSYFTSIKSKAISWELTSHHMRPFEKAFGLSYLSEGLTGSSSYSMLLPSSTNTACKSSPLPHSNGCLSSPETTADSWFRWLPYVARCCHARITSYYIICMGFQDGPLSSRPQECPEVKVVALEAPVHSPAVTRCDTSDVC